jgi:hypothetical protein
VLGDIRGLSVSLLAGLWLAVPVWSASISVENASFELPRIDPDPEAFGVLAYMEGWTELDLDAEGSTNTGIFRNTPVGSWDHVLNADGEQLAFLGSAEGNALEQDLAAVYRVGCEYRLTVGVGISARFPPSVEAPVDALELVLYYRDGAELVDIVSEPVEATGLSTTLLQDFSVYLGTVQSSDAWAGKAIGVAIRAAGMPGGFWDLDNVRLVESLPILISVENASFELPRIDPDPEAFGVLAYMEGWTELDLDAEGSTNTGIFRNTPVGSWDHVLNADGEQLAFLGSAEGNALEQDLAAVYRVGCEYRLTVGVGISARFPPSVEAPVDALELVLYYRDGAELVDIVSEPVEATGLSTTLLQDFSVYLGTVQSSDAWAGKAIGVAIRAAGMPGGFWDLDNVRLVESLPTADPAPATTE